MISFSNSRVYELVDGREGNNKYISFTLKVSLGVFFSSLLMQPSATENGPYDYTRSGNPTRDVLERLDVLLILIS